MKKNFLSKTAAVLAAAAMIAACGLSVSAESYIDTAVNEASVQAEDEAFTAVYEYDSSYDYDIVPTAKSSSSSGEKSTDWLKIIIVALVISILGTGLTVYFIYRGYKYNGMTEPYEYKDKAPLELSDREDVLIDVHVTTRHIERKND